MAHSDAAELLSARSKTSSQLEVDQELGKGWGGRLKTHAPQPVLLSPRAVLFLTRIQPRTSPACGPEGSLHVPGQNRG